MHILLTVFLFFILMPLQWMFKCLGSPIGSLVVTEDTDGHVRRVIGVFTFVGGMLITMSIGQDAGIPMGVTEFLLVSAALGIFFGCLAMLIMAAVYMLYMTLLIVLDGTTLPDKGAEDTVATPDPRDAPSVTQTLARLWNRFVAQIKIAAAALFRMVTDIVRSVFHALAAAWRDASRRAGNKETIHGQS